MTSPESGPSWSISSATSTALASAPDDYIAEVPSQVIEDVPANIPRVLLPEHITDLILKRSARIGKIRYLHILWPSAVP